MNLQRLQIPIERLSEMSASVQGLRKLGFSPEAARALLSGVRASRGSGAMSGGKARSGAVRRVHAGKRVPASPPTPPPSGGGRGGGR